jgi:ATP-dependent Lon protease
MGKLLDILLSLIAYLCVATVITLSLGLGYLWHNDQLTNEKLYRMVALMQDVDLQQIAAAQNKSKDEVPSEEPSLAQVMRRQQVQDRNFEVKLLALQRGKNEYEHAFGQLKEERDRYDRLARDWQSKLNTEEKTANQQNVAKVVSQLEQVSPEVGKASILRWIDEGKMDDAIALMSKMSENKMKNILRTFETPMELDKLHEIQNRILGGGANGSTLEKALGELNSLEGKK